MPKPTTWNEAMVPLLTVKLCGWVAMEGGSSTVRTATRLVTDPELFEARHA